VVLGDECFVGEHAVINPGVKVYPFKTVEANAIINSSIVWESRGARHLFGRHGVSGLANVDITPELAVRVAMAYATTVKKGAVVTTSRDSSRAGRALKRAVMVGLNAAGVDVSDLEIATVPVTRFQVRATQGQGGLTVRLDPNDPQSVNIRFFDADGLDIDEVTQRKIERLFYREDFRRSMAGEIGDIGFPARALERYSDSLMATVDTKGIVAGEFKVVLDYAYGSASFVMPNVLSKLGAEVLAVNPYAATAGAASFDRESHAARVADLVRASGAHLGAVIDASGERLTLIDDSGRVLAHNEALHALIQLITADSEGMKVAVPVATSRSIEELCQANGAELVWTKLSTPHLMEVASGGGVTFAASQDGGYIIADFLPAYDAAATIVHLLDRLAKQDVRLSKVVSRVPKVHMAHEQVVTPWEQKGTVMRTLVERLPDRETLLVDGVKIIHEEGWALVLPDPDDPITHIRAEGSTEREAKALAQEYARRIRQLL
ncbi:MAG: mannose-1-phosphate guanyltransferase, partial [Actinobacteria bacterium]|nr:mannose-1-phosphate guanyltransferase [Actinomycetota bacterium]